MLCESCGFEAPTRHVTLRQNIGALLVRYSKEVKGELCRDCIGKHFRSMSGTTLLLGWWGTISLLCTPVFLVNNVYHFIASRRLERAPADAVRPQLTDKVIARIDPHAAGMIERLNAGEPLTEVAQQVSESCGATRGEVALYAQTLRRRTRSG